MLLPPVVALSMELFWTFECNVPLPLLLELLTAFELLEIFILVSSRRKKWKELTDKYEVLGGDVNLFTKLTWFLYVPQWTFRKIVNLHFEAASNFSLFFFRRHFQGLKKRPKALNLLLRSKGGVRVPEPKLFVRKAAPFCFLAKNRKMKDD
ncbi:hypothetical protein FF38_01449 [Lucilia cuprina]|uniref:Uncharacterized protein n=1 Tax=Lucilia cuprina TaxID=7375 RepID=A0A0L0BVL4_LUCCU|nr:hypothetical protein FF38_01449 [Lucilia cuprina]